MQAGLWSLMSQILMVLSEDPVRIQFGILGLKCRAHTAWSWALRFREELHKLKFDSLIANDKGEKEEEKKIIHT